MDLFFEIAGDQIDGARDYQEDAFLTTYIDDDSGGDSKSSALVIMADGMGGHAAGNIASNLVVSTFNKNFTGSFGKQENPPLLRDSLGKANDALRESIKETPALDGMGCTMVTAAFSKGRVYWVSVGDSHLYLIRDRELHKHNEDHSYGGYLDRMKAQGVEVEAEAGLSRNMLMSAMTGDDIAEIDCPDRGLQLLAGDRVIIASDGLDTLSAGTIIQTSSWSPTAKECVQALLKAVDEEKKPRQDNTTVIVVDVMERPGSEAPSLQPVEEIEAAPPPTLADTQPIEAEQVQVTRVAEAPASKGGKTGLIVALLGIVVVAAAAGAYFFFLGGGPEPPVRTTQAPPPTPPAPPPTRTQPSTTQTQPTQTQPTQTQPTQTQPTQTQPTQTQPTQTQPTQTQPTQTQPTQTQPTQTRPVSPPQTTTPPPGGPKEFRDRLASGGKGPLMVVIPGGTFQMGSGGLSVEADERPRRTVQVDSLAVSKFEVTFSEYERFARATGRKIPDNLYLEKDIHPVLFVSWDDAYNYTQWLSKETGERYRLLSEAEWEYVASGGTDTPYWWGFDLEPNRAHCFDCRTGLNPRQPTRVGRFDPNPFGVHDTAGNVFEWVHDCYHPNYADAPATGEVWEGGDCAYRVARGGAYISTGKSIRVQKRARFKSQGVYDSVGIRIAREL